MGRTPCCSKVGLNRGPWTPEEDDLLTKYIDVYGEGGWRTLPKKAGLLRCGKSCRLRWMNYLRPDVKRGQILPEEEDLILRLHRLLGNRWSLIAGRIPGRTDNEIKNYWNTHLSRKLISQGIDPRTHKPLSESEVPAVSDSPGNNSKSAQKALQQQTSVSQHFDPPPHNLTPAIVSDYQEVTSEEIPKPADNNDNEGLQNVQNHNPSSRAAPTSETCVILHSPHLVPSVFNNFCAGEMSSNALSTPATANHMRSCHAFNPLGALAHSDPGIKHAQAFFAINNLAPLFSCPDYHASGVPDVVGAAPYLRTNSVTNNYYMAPSTSTASGWHRTSFFGHCVDPAPSDLPSPLISGINSAGGAGDKFPTTGTLEESVSMQHIIPSVNEVESATYSNIVHSSARTPVSAADHEDSNLDTFSSFLESFINEELLNENNELVAPTSASRTMQQCSDHGSTGVPYDSWSLMSPSSQYLAK